MLPPPKYTGFDAPPNVSVGSSPTAKQFSIGHGVRRLLIIFAGGAALIGGALLAALFLIPFFFSRDDIRNAIESGLNNALSSQGAVRLSGPPNKFAAELDTRKLAYRWQDGASYLYDFEFIAGEGSSKYLLEGRTELTIEGEKNLEFTKEYHSGGIVVGPNLIVASAQHAVNATVYACELPAKTANAQLVATDQALNLALLQTAEPLQPLSLSAAVPSEGDVVSLLLYPNWKGEPSTVSTTIVKSTTREGFSLQLDAPATVQQSGSPVFNAQEQLVGVIYCDGASTVGYLVPLDKVRAFIAKSGGGVASSSPPSGGPSDLELSRASGIRDITYHGWIDSRVRSVIAEEGYKGSANSIGFTSNGIRRQGFPRSMTLSLMGTASPKGEVAQLPFVFRSISTMLLHPFSVSDEDAWSVRYPLVPSREAAAITRRTPAGLLQVHPLSVLADLGDNTKPLPGYEELSYRVVSRDSDVATISVKHSLKASNSATESIQVHGEGTWKFNTASGVPISYEANLVADAASPDIAGSVPIRFKIQPVDPAVVAQIEAVRDSIRKELAEKAAKAAREKELEETVPNPELVGELLTAVASGKIAEQTAALKRLTRIAPVEALQPKVIAAMQRLIVSGGKLKREAWDVYGHWVNESNAPALRSVIERSPANREVALTILAGLKLKEDIPLMAAHITMFDRVKRDFLIAMGAEAEDAVLDELSRAYSSDRESALLQVLEDIGTEKSIEELEASSAAKPQSDGIRTRIAINRIRDRLKNQP